jgi:hypothetical protein
VGRLRHGLALVGQAGGIRLLVLGQDAAIRGLDPTAGPAGIVTGLTPVRRAPGAGVVR